MVIKLIVCVINIKALFKFIYTKQIVVAICLVLFFNTTAQNLANDTIKNKPTLNLSLGLRIFISRFEMGPKVASNIGINYRPKSNSKYEFFIRNYFHFSPTVPPLQDTVYPNSYYQGKNNNIRMTNYTSLLGFNKYFKKNKYKWGLALYYERFNQSGDKNFFIISGHYMGLENSFYAKYKWLNVAFRHQTQIIGQTVAYSRYVRDFDIFRWTQFSLCLEIPINLKL